MKSHKLSTAFLFVSILLISALMLSACDAVGEILGNPDAEAADTMSGGDQPADSGDKPGDSTGGTVPTTVPEVAGGAAETSGDKPGGTSSGGDSGSTASGSSGSSGSSSSGSSGSSAPSSCVPGAFNMGSISYGQTISTFTISAEGDIYRFNGNNGDAITITTNGTNSYDTFMELYDASCNLVASDDDSGTGLNAMLSGTLPSSGQYTIRVRGYAGRTGNYSISLQSGLVSPPVQPNNPPTGTYNMGSITCGQTVSTVTIYSGGDSYSFSGSAGQSVTIAMNGVNNYDTYLELYYGGAQIAYNDDGGPGLNSLLTATLPSSGTYTIIARGLGGALGNYSITVTCGTSNPPPSSTYNMGSIACGQTVSTNTITTGGDSYSFSGSAGQNVSIAMNGVNNYDTYLELYVNGSRLAYNDDGGPGLNSLLTATLPSTSNYTIIARGLGGALGSYTISVTCGGSSGGPSGGSAGGVNCVSGAFNMGSISFGQTVSTFTVNSTGDVYTFSGSAGSYYNISTSGTSNYDTYLELYDGYCTLIASNDDGGPGLYSLMSGTLPATGTYTIRVRGFGGSTGSYSITMTH